MRTVAIACALLVSGCSVLLMPRAPERVEVGQSVECSARPMVWDGGLFAFAAVSASVIYYRYEVDEDGPDASEGSATLLNATVIALAAAGAAYLGSALWGSRELGQCRDAQAKAAGRAPPARPPPAF